MSKNRVDYGLDPDLLSDEDFLQAYEEQNIQDGGPPEYDIRDLSLNFPDRYMIVGPSESGKSTVARNLLKTYWDTGRIVMTFWYGAHHEQEDYLPRKRRSFGVNKDQIDKLRLAMKKYFVPKKLYTIIVFDDIMNEKLRGGKDDRWWGELFTQSRHENIIIICCIHQINTLHPAARSSAKRWIITKSNVRLVDQLYEHSCAHSSKALFKELILGIEKGKPLMMDLNDNNGGEEIHKLVVNKLDSEEMK